MAFQGKRRVPAFLCTIVFLCPASRTLASSFVAYLDPGTGSIVLQMVVGGVLGGLLVIKIFWRKIVAVLRKILGKGKKRQAGEASSPETH